jgi:galactokinase/mevalonate kinase-like predicted kinase
MIISRTPCRISFFGGGTDYPAWYLKHGGAVLATAIDKLVEQKFGHQQRKNVEDMASIRLKRKLLGD